MDINGGRWGIDEDGEVGFEEGIPWLPSHLLHEALWDAEEYARHQRHRGYRWTPRFPLDERLQDCNQRSKSSPRTHCSAKYLSPTFTGGPGMRAVFLDSGGKSCGTGVFLPRTTGTNSQPNKRPVCSPVLLPMRVVHALNLNVHELGLQISPQQGTKRNQKGDGDSVKNKSAKETAMQCSVLSKNHIPSPEIFLPKEWTY